ncbi:conserved hypothetical protein [Rhodoferax ferrireducens T118]|uniref:ABM domain-containing protein n=1 Tax=Albidiferax ferrireducens (strain ATCC BAA-621 / DSM 15236 / T118) TaxID=338969 RepID=Q222Z1_ALBFT|nr:hypothetical protein [Rhodoferax ferrireducens]ABD67912.1 conserved hypothetical protein [Rhodoferax ferrireducens T118]
MIKTVEAFTYKLAVGTVPSAFVAANGKVNEWLKKQPGFLKRELSQLEDDSWLDIAHWKSAAEAKQAGEKFMTELSDCECMSMIDPDSNKMSHGELHLAI